MKGRKAAFISAALGLLVLILDSRNSIASASQGVDICIKTVVPSLFPFFVLSILLTGNLGSTQALRPLEKLFRAEGCGGILVSGFLGGYPVGAQAAAQGYRSGAISREQANRLLLFCSQAGPSFLFGMAASRFPDATYAWMLWLIQIMSALCVAWISPPPESGKPEKHDALSMSPAQAMKKATRAMASVCGWVILFRVILSFLEHFLFFTFPPGVRVLLSGFLELTNGCLMLSDISDISLRFLLAVLMLNFGGICVMMQTASVVEGLDLKYYIRGKLLQSVFSMLICFAFLGYYASLIPLCILFLLNGKENREKTVAFPQPLVYNHLSNRKRDDCHAVS